MSNPDIKTALPDWLECVRISELPAVHEVIQAFADEPTGDQGVMIVRAVLEALAEKDADAVQPMRTKFMLQRKSFLPHWEDETAGNDNIEDALACVKFCTSSPGRPLRIIEVAQRTVMDQAAIDAALQSAGVNKDKTA